MVVPQGLGTIIINGGTINAQGGTWYVYYDKAGGAAGIGSAEDSGATFKDSSFGNNTYINNITGSITINGGTVNATGGFGAAGIGGGNMGTVKTITITGGTVTANGGYGAAIGLGYNGATDGTLTCPIIEFTGGTTTANGNIGYSKELLAGHDIGGKVTIGASANVTCSGSIKPFDAASIPENSYIDADGNRQIAQNPTSVLNMETWSEGWWVVDQYAEFNNRVVVNGTVNLIINDGVTLNAKKGIQVHRGNTLNIYTQQSGTGLIKATGDNSNAGIGGGYVKQRSGTFEDKSCGTINIYGGTIEARGGIYAAGIGCGYIKSETTDGGTINIYGGTVTAWGNDGGAGIGSGRLTESNSYTNPQTIHIYGGRVTAYNGGSGSDGIGKGKYGKDGTTTLGWTNVTDAIYANGYSGTVTLTSNFMLENSETKASKSNISGKLMVTPVVVSFAAGGGSGKMDNITTAYERHYTLPSCTFTPPTDKEFDRWYVDGTSYNVGDEIVVTENTVVMAMWKEAPRTVQFNLNGHGDAVDSQVLPYDDMADEPAAPTAIGYTFGGWFKEQTCVNRWNFATEHVTRHITLYAKWTENAYSIAYDLNGGVETTSNPLSYTIEDADIVLAAPVKTGYNFTGWTYEGQDEPVLSVTIAKGSTGDKNFTAHWQIAQFTITFNTDGGTVVDPITQDYNTSVSWPSVAPKKAKHIFLGWANLPAKMPGENITVDAIWVSVSPVEAREATCSENGMIACYYAFGYYYREESDGITYTRLYPSDYLTPALGHVWTNPTWTWENSYYDGRLTATLLLTCSRCQRPDHSITSEFTTEVTTEPTVTFDGVLTYTANIEVDGTNYSDTYDEVIPRTGVVAKIGNTEYPYLKTALAAASDGDVVTLCQDIYEPSETYGTPNAIHHSFTLDMSGHSVYVAGICLDNDMTLKNGTFTGRINNYSVGNPHALTLDNATLNCEGFYDGMYDVWQTGIEWLATDIAVTNGSLMYIAGRTYLGGGADDGFNLTIDGYSSVVLSNAILSGYNNTRVRSEFAKYLPAGYSINNDGKVEYENSEYCGFVTLQLNSLNIAAKHANGAYWTTYDPSQQRILLSRTTDNRVISHYYGYYAPEVNSYDGNTWRDISPAGGIYSYGGNYWPVVSPNEPDTYFFSYRSSGGVAKVQNNNIVLTYNNNNSPLMDRAVALRFDSKGNLWMPQTRDQTGHIDVVAISAQNQALTSVTPSMFVINDLNGACYAEGFKRMTFDIGKNDTKVFSAGDYNSPLVIWNNNDDLSVNKYKKLTSFIDQNNKNFSTYAWVYLKADRDSMIWAGTESGLIAFDPTQAFNDDFRINRIEVKIDEGVATSGNLLEGTQVNCIDVDSQNRKWIGTNTAGVYFVSADGSEIYKHFDSSVRHPELRH